jgi:hypothetical protein
MTLGQRLIMLAVGIFALGLSCGIVALMWLLVFRGCYWKGNPPA